MSELRRQAAAIVAGMTWTTTHEPDALRAMGAEMTDLGYRAGRTVAKARGLAMGYGQRDPLGWLIPLHDLGQALTDAGAWWTETVVEGFTWDTAIHGRRQDADFAVLRELGELISSEMQRSEEAEASGAVIDPEQTVQASTPPAPAQPSPARHARPEYGGPALTYRQKRRLAPYLWPAGVAGLLLAAGLIYAATAGHPGASPAASGRPDQSPSIGAAGLSTPNDSTTPTPSSAPSTTTARTTSPTTPAAVVPTTAVTGSGPVVVVLVSTKGSPDIQVLISVDETSSAADTLYITEYGTTSAGQRTADVLSERTLSGKTAYAVSYVLDASRWCGDQVTVVAVASSGTSASQAEAEC